MVRRTRSSAARLCAAVHSSSYPASLRSCSERDSGDYEWFKVFRSTAVQPIADWLNKLGMSEYEPRFAENRIDLSVLPDLTDQDLEKLGVVLGDRRKILRAIAKLETHKSADIVTV